MKVKAARQVLSTIYGGVLPPGALWVSGILDEAAEAEKTVKKAKKRNAAAKKRRAQSIARRRKP